MDISRIDATIGRDGWPKHHFVYWCCPTGSDAKTVKPGDHVYGQDGREWVVDGIGGDPYDVVGHEPSGSRDHMQPLKSAWLTHERPQMTRKQVAKRLRELAVGSGMSRVTVERKIGELADELERGE